MKFLEGEQPKVTVTKVRLRKDKDGIRWVLIELAMAVSGDLAGLTPQLLAAVKSMEKNPKVEVLKLSETIPDRNLHFANKAGMPAGREFRAVGLERFELRRQAEDEIGMRFAFEVGLEKIKGGWLEEAFGCELVLTVEAAQRELLGEKAGVGAPRVSEITARV